MLKTKLEEHGIQAAVIVKRLTPTEISLDRLYAASSTLNRLISPGETRPPDESLGAPAYLLEAVDMSSQPPPREWVEAVEHGEPPRVLDNAVIIWGPDPVTGSVSVVLEQPMRAPSTGEALEVLTWLRGQLDRAGFCDVPLTVYFNAPPVYAVTLLASTPGTLDDTGGEAAADPGPEAGTDATQNQEHSSPPTAYPLALALTAIAVPIYLIARRR